MKWREQTEHFAGRSPARLRPVGWIDLFLARFLGVELVEEDKR